MPLVAFTGCLVRHADFTEIMRALGYPRLVSLDNFRVPNFQLVADALYWMVKRYDPDIDVSDNIESENDRVEFLTGVAVVSKQCASGMVVIT